MIDIKNKQDCCGCEACVQKCPKHCITLIEDNEGFLYPQVDKAICIDCGLCQKVCPVINSIDSENRSLSFFAAQSKSDELRLKSSSGGLFSLLAENVIRKGGVVFGAKFDRKMTLLHSYTETMDGLEGFRGSKYVQSRIGHSFEDVERFLKNGRLVLFTGVPCQVKALKFFLRKQYDNLITVDVICHGVPSPGVFRDYLSHLGKGKEIIDYKFRDKSTGWVGFSSSFTLANGKKRSFRRLFDFFFGGGLELHLFLRPSCFHCPSKGGSSLSDITLGDLWHISMVPQISNDDKGASLISVNSHVGNKLLHELDLQYLIPQSETLVRKYNTAFYCSAHRPDSTQLAAFWDDYSHRGFIAVVDSCKKYLVPSFQQRRWIEVKIILKKMLSKLRMHR